MKMICPQCQESFENQLNCPACGVKLTYKTVGRAKSGELAGFAQSDAYKALDMPDGGDGQAHSSNNRWLVVIAALAMGVVVALSWMWLRGS
jgi:hypothetical protein